MWKPIGLKREFNHLLKIEWTNNREDNVGKTIIQYISFDIKSLWNLKANYLNLNLIDVDFNNSKLFEILFCYENL